jgi:ABC-type multidrug transport system fused ATPase/permease subunit
VANIDRESIGQFKKVLLSESGRAAGKGRDDSSKATKPDSDLRSRCRSCRLQKSEDGARRAVSHVEQRLRKSVQLASRAADCRKTDRLEASSRSFGTNSPVSDFLLQHVSTALALFGSRAEAPDSTSSSVNRRPSLFVCCFSRVVKLRPEPRVRVHKPKELDWLIQQAKPMLHLHILSLLCITSGSFLTLLDPLIMKWLIDVALPRKNGQLLLIGTSAFAAVYLARLALMYCGSLISFTAVQKMIFRTRLKLIRELHRRSARYHENTTVGETVYRLEQDVSRVGDLGGDMLPNMIRMLLVSVMVVATMCVLNGRLTLLVLPLMPIFFLLQKKYRKQLVSAADASQEQLGKMSSILQEHLAGIVQLLLLNRHGRHAGKYARQSADAAKAQIQQRFAEVRFSATYLSVIVLGSTLILGFGGHEVIRNRLTIGGLVAFYSYVTRLFEPLSIAVDLQSRTQRVSASIRRILQLQDSARDNEPSVGHRLSREVLPILEFCSVSFRHRKDRATVDSLNVCVRSGEKIALVGLSGCGKSTIAHLAVGLYKPDDGSILLNGKDIQLVDRRNLRSVISLVPQEPVLFEGTLRENLLYGDPHATNRDIEWILSLAQLEVLVRTLPRGLDEPLGPMGRKLSGGEKKRVAVARALLMRPKILILDEITNGLDGLTSMHLLDSLDDFQPGTTLIFISHKPETIAAADRILVLSGGRIIDEGSHFELIRRCDLYQELHRRRSDSGIFEEINDQRVLNRPLH